MKRLLLTACVSLAIVATLAQAELIWGASQRRPNIIFIFTDDHAPHAISAYGSKINKTPNIDRLAKEGMIFHNCFVTNSICAPSRAVILTGKHSHLNGVIDNGVTFDGSQVTFPKLLRQAGYQTAIVGKWHLKSEPTGFDYWKVLVGQGTYYNPVFRTPKGREQYTGYTTDIITDLVLDWLENKRDKSRPFLLMYQHKAPHREWLPGPKHLNLYKDVQIPEPPTLFDDYSTRTRAAAWATMRISRDLNDLDLKFTLPNYLTPEQRAMIEAAYREENEAFLRNPPKGKELVRWRYQRYIKDYLRCIASVDENIGRLLQYLDETGLADNTVVIYSSDQGFYLGDHGWFDKRWMYEESLRMPLIVRWPGVVKPGSHNYDLVQNLDFAETFLDIAGVPIPKEMQGHSLVPLLKGETPSDWRKSIYYRYYEFPSWHDVMRHEGVRTKRYKLIHFYLTGEWELYDLEKDPHELNNVYDDPAYAGVARELKAELARLRKLYRVDEFPEPPVPTLPWDVKPQLVLHYSPESIADGTAQDLSGKQHNGALRNVKIVETATAEHAKAFRFDGNSSIIVQKPPASLDPFYKPLTIAVSCCPEKPDGVLVAHGQQFSGYGLYLEDGRPTFVVRTYRVPLRVQADEPLEMGKWVQLAASADANRRLTLYVNGKEVARLEDAHIVVRPIREAFSIGTDAGGPVDSYERSTNFVGLIDDIRIYWGTVNVEQLCHR